VGQAFHWFDVPKAMPEIRRVLRPAGSLGLFWNMLDDGDPVTREFADLVDAEERSSLMREDQPAPYIDVPGMSQPVRRMFAHAEHYEGPRLVDFVASRSQTILAADADRTRLLDDVLAFAGADGVTLKLVCEAWRGDRTS